jgi:hypothetical protein
MMEECVIFHNNDSDKQLYDMDIRYKKSRGGLIIASIADIHMGVIDPKTQYDILKEQYLNIISELPKLDIIAIDGDLYDHKIMANSAAAMYGSLLISDIVNIARIKNSTVVLIVGTKSHDNDTLRLYYSYVNDPTVDFRLVETIRFEYIKGAKILCVPELYGVDEEVYQYYLHNDWYDMCFMHGTFKGAVYGDNVGQGRLFTIDDFDHCLGLMISGHVHIPGCYSKYFYYCGSPIRWRHGEEQEKGFLLTYINLDTMSHYMDFVPIQSFKYKTIDLDDIISEDPQVVINYINDLKESEYIDYIKIRFNHSVSNANKIIMNNYYRSHDNVSLEFMSTQEEELKKAELETTMDKYNFILDPNLTDEQKFVMYVNEQEGYEFISIEQLTEILND